MSTKKIIKVALIILTLALCFSVCSCTYVEDLQKEAVRAQAFADEVTEVVEFAKSTDVTTEELTAKAEELIHESSDLTLESIIDEVKQNEKLESINFESVSADDIDVGNFDIPSVMNYDEELGGNVYEVDIQVTVTSLVDGVETPVTFEVTLILLSNDSGMGIYDFIVK